MMQVDLEKCTGCGGCLEACPSEAISMVDERAAIDNDTCLSCGVCADACPEGAISEVRLPVPVTAAAIQPIKMQPGRPVPVTTSESRQAWSRPVLSFIGHEIVPRMADILMSALDRRLSAPSKTQAMINPNTVRPINGGGRQMRRRRRGKKL